MQINGQNQPINQAEAEPISPADTTIELKEAEQFEKIQEVAQTQFDRISYIRMQPEASVIARWTNPLFILAGDATNKYSILRGALKNWDSTRLLAGKHVSFDKIGAEHIQLGTKYNDKIDATYLEIATFAQKLEEFGGQRVKFRPHFSASDPYTTKEEKLTLRNGFSFNALSIDQSALVQHNYDIQPLEAYYKNKKMTVIQDRNGHMYAVPNSIYQKLMVDKQIKENELNDEISDKETINEDQLELTKASTDPLSTEFGGYYFEKKSPELKQVLENLEIGKTPWILREYGDKAFLVRRRDLPSIEICYRQDPSLSNLEMDPAASLQGKDTDKQGTVILSMNQTEIYEQYGSEFLTFALEGVNVIAYNNGGKGLSEGRSDTSSINNSIEVVYQYVKDHKQIPDDKILAKGQCFGGAPTAWLGREHPQISLMLDQSPANFYDVAANIMKDKLGTRVKTDDVQELRLWAVNYIIDGVAKAVLAGYDTADNLRNNRGNQLIHHNVPNEFGAGGDKLVSDEHFDRLVEASRESDSEGVKQVSLNPGGIHVSHWFSNPSSYKSVMDFFQQASLVTDMYES